MGQIRDLFGKYFDSKPVNNDKFIKSKINFDTALPEGNYYSYFSVISLGSISVKDKNHPQILLKHVKLYNEQGKIISFPN